MPETYSQRTLLKHDISVGIHKVEPHYFAIGEVSDVYRCRFMTSDGTEKPVAVKVMRGFTSGEYGISQFKENLGELVARWRQLSHSNVMECFGTCHNFGHLPGLVLPMCTNGNIMQYLDTHHRARKLDLMFQVASAVKYLHSSNFVHADIRGANILMQDDIPLLMDGGLSPLVAHGDFTTAGICGHPRWMAPEILDPPDEIPIEEMEEVPCTPETDVYALGMTILEVMTGKQPYNHRRYDTVVMFDVIRGIRPIKPDTRIIPDKIWDIITACWQADPQIRPPATLVESWLNAVRFAEVMSTVDGRFKVESSNTIVHTDES